MTAISRKMSREKYLLLFLQSKLKHHQQILCVIYHLYCVVFLCVAYFVLYVSFLCKPFQPFIMRSKNRCCVPSCDRLNPVIHRFPVNFKHVYNTWIERIQVEKFQILDPVLVHRSYYVCDKHFDTECKLAGTKRLKFYSVPTLFLPGGPYEQCFVFPSGPATTNMKDDNAYELGDRSCVLEEHDYASILMDPRACFGENSTVFVDHDYTSNRFPARTEIDLQASSSDAPLQGSSTAAEVPIPMDISPTCDVSGTSTVLPNDPANLMTPCKKRLRRLSSKKNTGKRGKNLLKQINMTQKDLTPRMSFMYKTAARLREGKNKLEKRCLSYKERLSAAESFSESGFYKTLVDTLDKTTYNFIMCQLRNKKLKPKGRRFTSDDKIMALSLYKQSGKGYRLLSKMFALPSRKTMMALLYKVPFNTGVNKKIYQNLKASVAKLKSRDRNCVLLFDEVAIAPHLEYNKFRDEIDGFEDLGGGERKAEFASHALVFMVRGITKKYKQPVGYFFTTSRFKSVCLVRLIKKIVRAVRQAGLKIVATICDQAQTNQSAINYLKKDSEAAYMRRGEEYKKLGYEIDGKEVLHLYDAPHLLKGVRNNMLTKNVIFRDGGIEKVAKWDHVQQLYDLDKNTLEADFKLCPKLTEYHVDRTKIKKMKVSNAAQVMSQRVSAVMRKLAQLSDQYGNNMMDPKATDTADFLLFIDRLFDSVNGTSIFPRNGKLLRCAVTKKSKHVEFWNDALELLATVKFVCPLTNKTTLIPSINNWIQNLKVLKYLTEKLINSGFKFICLRNLNQDPLENYFGQIRSHGNTNPTASNFRNSFKTLLLNNFVSSHSVGANCEEEETDGALSTLKHFVQIDSAPENEQEDGRDNEGLELLSTEDVALTRDNLADDTCRYVAGYIAKNILKKSNCQNCKNDIISNNVASNIIACREYKSAILKNPTEKFATFIKYIKCIFNKNFANICYKNNIAFILSRFICSTVNFNLIFSCKEHNIAEEIVNYTIKFLIFTYVKDINRILCGKLRINQSCDAIKDKAIKYVQKREHSLKKKK